MTKEYILITGVAGLLGSRMADWIIENKSDQFTVVGIDNLFGGYIENVHPDVIFYREELATANLKQIFDKYNFEFSLILNIWSEVIDSLKKLELHFQID